MVLMFGWEESKIICLLEENPFDEAGDLSWLTALANICLAISVSSLLDFPSRIDSIEDFEEECFSFSCK